MSFARKCTELEISTGKVTDALTDTAMCLSFVCHWSILPHTYLSTHLYLHIHGSRWGLKGRSWGLNGRREGNEGEQKCEDYIVHSHAEHWSTHMCDTEQDAGESEEGGTVRGRKWGWWEQGASMPTSVSRTGSDHLSVHYSFINPCPALL